VLAMKSVMTGWRVKRSAGGAVGVECALGLSLLCALVSSHLPLLCRSAETEYTSRVDVDANLAGKVLVPFQVSRTQHCVPLRKRFSALVEWLPLYERGQLRENSFCAKLIEQHATTCTIREHFCG